MKTTDFRRKSDETFGLSQADTGGLAVGDRVSRVGQRACFGRWDGGRGVGSVSGLGRELVGART